MFTRVCKGLQGFTRVYRGLQGFTGVFQGFARVYKGLQGFTGVYKGLHGLLWDSWETLWGRMEMMESGTGTGILIISLLLILP